jgi:hypothetical protein
VNRREFLFAAVGFVIGGLIVAPPSKVLLPGNLDAELGDLRRQIQALNTAAAPQELTYSESVDNTHAMDLDFVIGKGAQVVVARLSFKFKPYRATSSSAGGNSGAGSSHAHGSAAHSHSHSHGFAVSSGTGNQTVSFSDVSNTFFKTGAAVTDTADVQSNATSTTPGSTGGEAAHTHSVGASSLAVSEGGSTTVSALSVDGVDKTSLLGGPWASDTVDLDLKAVMPVGDGGWHVVTLTPVAQGRIVAVLRLA